jgi:decaprenyl-phosphate phosphoribosyltransferase
MAQMSSSDTLTPDDQAAVKADHTHGEASPPGPLSRFSRAAVGIVKAARPRQWLKNILVFAAPGAAGVLTHRHGLLLALAAFGVFCITSSGTYLLNDLIDVEADRHHPLKCRRPIACGDVGPRTAAVVSALLLAGGLAAGIALRPQLGLVVGIYIAIQIAYNLYLKHQPVLDIVTVASGFVIRAIAGAVVIPVAISEWFLIVTSFGSLLMVTGKRLAEHAELGDSRGHHRVTLNSYSREFLLTVLGLSAAGGIIGYALWAFSLQTAVAHHHRALWCQLSIVPVVIALLRYTWLVEQGHGGRPEHLVVEDRTLMVLGTIWVILFALVTYAH